MGRIAKKEEGIFKCSAYACAFPKAQEAGFTTLSAFVVQLYNEGNTSRQIGAILQVSAPTVTKYLRKLNVKVKPRGGPNNKFKKRVKKMFSENFETKGGDTHEENT